MVHTITPIFEDGVLKPAQPLDLPKHPQVRLTVEPLGTGLTTDEILAALDDLVRLANPHPGPHLTRDELHERR